MSDRDRTSIELPRAVSGSNELMGWPGVTSPRPVPSGGIALPVLPCADTVPICATKQKMEIAVAARLSRTRLTIFSVSDLTAIAIVPPLRRRFGMAPNQKSQLKRNLTL